VGYHAPTKRLTYFTASYQQAAWIFPSVVAAPRYFNGRAYAGGLIQTMGAFQPEVRLRSASLSIRISRSLNGARWWSALRFRSGGLTVSASRAATGAASGARGDARHLTVERCGLYLPDGQPLLADVKFSRLLGAATPVLLGGGSGSGKSSSSLHCRNLAIWPWRIRKRRTTVGISFSAAEALPADPVRSGKVVSYPMPTCGVVNVTLSEALEAVGLPGLAGRLDEAGHWALQLSPGEQQRIAFARRWSRDQIGSSSTRRLGG